MNKKLAILGNPQRSKDIIKILEMLGGNNIYDSIGNCKTACYTIDGDSNICCECLKYLKKDHNYELFTIEEFLEKYPYKIGDKVDFIKYDNDEFSVYEIIGMVWTGTTIEYTLDSFGFTCLTKDIRLHKENNMNKNFKSLNVETYLKVWDETENGLEVCVAEGYEMIEKNGQFYIVKQKTKYPRDFDECCEVLNTHLSNVTRPIGWKENLISKFQELIICRDAYWKIAGEQMGLGKPWEFKLGSDSKEVVYAISVFGTGIMLDFYYALNCNKILVFPTEEIRNIFYNNFKNIIEQCKEFL